MIRECVKRVRKVAVLALFLPAGCAWWGQPCTLCGSCPNGSCGVGGAATAKSTTDAKSIAPEAKVEPASASMAMPK